MSEEHKQEKVVITGRELEVRENDQLIQGEAANILQATPKSGYAMEMGQFRSADSQDLFLSQDEDVLELTLEDNLVLFTSLGRLKEDIIPRGERGRKDGVATLPARLRFTNQRTRGEDGLLIKTVRVLDIQSKFLDAAAKKGGSFAARKIAEKIEAQLVGPDILYHLVQTEAAEQSTVRFETAVPDQIDTSKPMLLFIHGTASSSSGSFSELWNPSGAGGDTVWQDLRNTYADNIYALEHQTLTHSPIDNIVDLMEILPTGCRLHLVSHSRGGLLGELLCRVSFKNSRQPFTDDDIALFDAKMLSAQRFFFPEVQKDYQHHQDQLRKLNTLLLEKQPVIERFVRVACPARGTTLASGKLDIYLSGILNVIGLIAPLKTSPLYGLLKAFTLAVAKERTRPEQLPGLEAQMPGSPFIAMLNSTPEKMTSHLAVIKGDIEPTGILKKISMFFLDRFYESDHDLVVNTPSMDGGGQRESRIPVLFDQGKEINHFSYFENTRTRKGLFHGLTDKHPIPKGFRLELQKRVEIARTLPKDTRPDEVPSVFILPGITGSHLEIAGNRIWIDFFDLVRGNFSKLGFKTVKGKAQTINPVSAEKPVQKTYGTLIEYLAKSHYVIPFAYDWRRSILESGKRLGDAVQERLEKSEQPVRIVAHSMGGLVARGMMSQCPGIWRQMRERPGSRVLMLGTPNRGSYSIPRIFAGQDKLIQMLALADLHHSQVDLLRIIRRFPGVLELLPVDRKGRLEITASIWEAFRLAINDGWEAPFKMDLKWAEKTWEDLARVNLDPSAVFYVAGHAKETPIAVEVTGEKGREIVFTATSNGDGQVPWTTGIPPGIQHWYVNAVHGDIPDHSPAYQAFEEILQTGSTSRLATQPPVPREAVREKIMLPDVIDVFPGEDQLLAAAAGQSDGDQGSSTGLPPLHITIVHGNLRFSSSALAVGHYQGDTVVSAEAVLDKLLDHRLSKRQQNGIYPGPLGTHEVLFNGSKEEFPGAVVVGLGQVGELTPGSLTNTFRDAVIRYVMTGRETGQFHQKPIALSTLLIGTGAGELSIKDSLVAISRGVQQANGILAGPTINIDNIVSQIEFIELHEDLAIAAQHALLEVAQQAEFAETVTTEKTIKNGNGGRTRAYFSEEAEWWQRLRIEETDDGGLKYTTLGARARAEIQIQSLQRRSINPFLKALTTQTATSKNAGRVLFELLIPPELKNHAADNQRLMLVVDKGAAAYPWELLEYGWHDGNEALAIKAGMIRQLATSSTLSSVVCLDKSALIVGDPFSGIDSPFPDLPGARKEAIEVASVLQQNHIDVGEPLIGSSGAQILSSLMTKRFGLLHLAGHGVVDYALPPDFPGGKYSQTAAEKHLTVSGMLIGENHFLTPVEIRQMPYTPAFVFVNCCHLGKITGEAPPYLGQRYRLAANIGAQFIAQGVKAVIAAGWAVDDNAALTFARSFYGLFLNGRSFGEAVQQARATTYAHHPTVNTWGAYQCYGDPDYRFSPLSRGKKRLSPPSFVSLTEYITAIKNIAQDATTVSYAGVQGVAKQLTHILDNIPDEYAGDANLLAAAGDAWGELDNFEYAIAAYEKALLSQKAHATLRCAEQRANFICRKAVKVAEKGDLGAAEEMTDEALVQLNALNMQFGESVERLSLLGGTYKRRAQLWRTEPESLKDNLTQMYDCYHKAYRQNLNISGKVYTYPLLNSLTADWLLHKAGAKNDLVADFDLLLNSAKQANFVPEVNLEFFWQAIALNDCRLLELLKKGELTEDETTLLGENYRKICTKASSARQMRSVEEHVAFLHGITAQIQEHQARQLEILANLLKSLR